jgi:hypothetical protein
MYELNITSRKQLERASLRAQAQKPRIEEIALGMYRVWSTNPTTPYNSYSTGIFPAKDGNGYDVCCSCPTQRTFCKHVAAVFPHYLMRMKEQVEPEAAEVAAPEIEPVAPVCGCGKDAYAHFNGTWFCIDCLKEKQAQIAEAERLYPDLLKNIYQAAAEYTDAQAEKDRFDLFG